MTVYFFYIMPYSSYIENLKSGISEVLLILMQISAGFLVKDEDM
jgi:hypothetical protein